MTTRKMWATTFPAVPGSLKKHSSKIAAYNYVEVCGRQWAAGLLRSKTLKILVDEQDGHGWLTYEKIDLSEEISCVVRQRRRHEP